MRFLRTIGRLGIAAALLVAACHKHPKPAASAPSAASASTMPSAPATEAARSEATPSEPVPRTIDKGDGWTIEITKDGYGPPARIGDEVSLAYTAKKKSDDQVIASTRDWTAPFRMRLGEKGVMPGLARAIEGLRAGSTARIEIPPALAYGKDGNPGANVPANETLVFEVEVLGIR
jgi:FKBP-type peptidyl-prolyl cis-trans isomerase